MINQDPFVRHVRIAGPVRVNLGPIHALTQGPKITPVVHQVALSESAAVAFATTPPIAEVNVRDPTNYGAVVLYMTLIAIGASYLPARRASRVDPAITLRAE